MKTTVTLDREIVDEVRQRTAAKTKTRAVTVALQEYLRRKKIEQLRGLLGRVEIDEAAIRRRRKLELSELEKRHG